jgi:hypothetical protein
MTIRKLSQEEWAYEINRAMQVRDVQRQKMSKAKFTYVDRVIRRLLPLPYIIGAIAIFLLIYLYGWAEFFKFFLSWCVSLTLVATGAYYVWKYYERQL